MRGLANHLFHVVVEFQKLAARQDADFTSTPSRVAPGGDWRERFAQETDKLVAAWSVPGAEDGTTGAWQLPARLVGSMALLDLVVHGWDLARATGRTYPVDEELAPVVEELEGAVARLAPTGRSTGAFGEAVPVPEGAPAFERLLGGRRDGHRREHARARRHTRRTGDGERPVRRAAGGPLPRPHPPAALGRLEACRRLCS
ncbi:hypothetical protein GCM10020256_31950 [Streptomyces thermocoprophilus]